MGLSLMGYRARLIGGEITIGRSQTGGCLVTFTRPIDEGPDCDPEDLERPGLENAAEPELPLRFDGSPPPADR